MKNFRFNIILLVTAIALSIPLIAMQFTDQVDWGIFDFAVMGTLLLVTGVSVDFVLRKVESLQNKVILCGVVLLVFFLVWAELAVGIFGSPWAGS